MLCDMQPDGTGYACGRCGWRWPRPIRQECRDADPANLEVPTPSPALSAEAIRHELAREAIQLADRLDSAAWGRGEASHARSAEEIHRLVAAIPAPLLPIPGCSCPSADPTAWGSVLRRLAWEGS